MNKKKTNLFSPTPSIVKRGTVAMLCLMLTGLFLIAGCKKDDPVISGGDPDGGGENLEYPIDVPLTKYSLVGTSCRWIGCTNPFSPPNLIVINSNEEMEEHINCFMGDSYPEIDFTQHTLLLAYGYADYDVSEFIIENLQQLSVNEYKLNIGMALDVNTVAREWVRAFTVSKLSEESNIELNITCEYYPIEIPFTDYYMYHSYVDPPCWDVLYPLNGSLIVINSEKELEKYFICADDYPAIDFSKHTLLMASGSTVWVIEDINTVFLKNSANLYTLKATISTGILTTGEYWSIAILAPKIEDEAIVIFIKN